MHVAEVIAPTDTDLLRLSTAGSVDDGKSTLIGRLLHDTRVVLQDQLEHVEATSRARGDRHVDLSLLTDGLRAEREQGITIDVAYRYFTTARRRFIIADTPGHVQYTRNMVTGASTADLAVVLVDARRGLTEQSRRHLSIAALLRTPHVLVAVNKMDLVDWSRERFVEICDELGVLAIELGVREVTFVPVSALHGDNVVGRTRRAPWYGGPTLLEHLETVQVADERPAAPLRFPVQWVVRPRSAEHADYRGYAGQLATGTVRPGDRVVVLPGGYEATVAAVDLGGEQVDSAAAPLSVTVRLTDDLDVSRGSLIAAADAPATVGRELDALVCWMGERPLVVRGTYVLKQTTNVVRVRVERVVAGLELATGRPDPSVSALGPNDLGRIELRAAAPVAYDPFSTDRVTGSFVLIDEVTDTTVAAGMLLPG